MKRFEEFNEGFVEQQLGISECEGEEGQGAGEKVGGAGSSVPCQTAATGRELDFALYKLLGTGR
jgi:hypothetical protein